MALCRSYASHKVYYGPLKTKFWHYIWRKWSRPSSKKLLEFESEINLSKIDHSQPISELSEQAKAKIDEILYKQELKDKGQFTRDEAKVLNVLDEAWNLESSPFQGDFDLSQVDIV